MKKRTYFTKLNFRFHKLFFLHTCSYKKLLCYERNSLMFLCKKHNCIFQHPSNGRDTNAWKFKFNEVSKFYPTKRSTVHRACTSLLPGPALHHLILDDVIDFSIDGAHCWHIYMITRFSLLVFLPELGVEELQALSVHLSVEEGALHSASPHLGTDMLTAEGWNKAIKGQV